MTQDELDFNQHQQEIKKLSKLLKSLPKQHKSRKEIENRIIELNKYQYKLGMYLFDKNV